MDNLNRLIEIFSHFPGIGPRQARRFAYYLLGKPQSFINEFMKLVGEVKSTTSQCGKCQRLFIESSNSKISIRADLVNDNLCNICSDKSRDLSTLMIVARDSDFESIEKSGAYRGLYFILGGIVPILDKDPEKRIRLKSLLERIASANKTPQQFKEIILSLNTTPDGEHTTEIVHAAVNRLAQGKSGSPKITILGRGLSTGAELEYVDSETIKSALKNRG
jgi:recombination protein RecR